MVLLGQLIACVNTSTTVSTVARHKESEHEKSYANFTHQGMPVSPRMFKFLHSVGEKRLKNLTRSLKENGLSPRTHGNAGRKPKHALSLSSIEYVVWFLFMYAKQHAPSRKSSRVQPLRHTTFAIKYVQVSHLESVPCSS